MAMQLNSNQHQAGSIPARGIEVLDLRCKETVHEEGSKGTWSVPWKG